MSARAGDGVDRGSPARVHPRRRRDGRVPAAGPDVEDPRPLDPRPHRGTRGPAGLALPGTGRRQRQRGRVALRRRRLLRERHVRGHQPGAPAAGARAEPDGAAGGRPDGHPPERGLRPRQLPCPAAPDRRPRPGGAREDGCRGRAGRMAPGPGAGLPPRTHHGARRLGRDVAGVDRVGTGQRRRLAHRPSVAADGRRGRVRAAAGHDRRAEHPGRRPGRALLQALLRRGARPGPAQWTAGRGDAGRRDGVARRPRTSGPSAG